MVTAYLGIGANLGNPLEQLRTARSRLAGTEGIALRRSSPLYRTQPIGGPDGQPDYLNGVLEISTTLHAHELLSTCQHLEQEAGRCREVPHGPRTLDLDVLLYDNISVSTQELYLPHPRLHERRFVLTPLCDLAGEIRHPGLGVSMNELLAHVSDQQLTLAYKDW